MGTHALFCKEHTFRRRYKIMVLLLYGYSGSLQLLQHCDNLLPSNILSSGIYLTFKVTADVPVTHVAANTDSTVPSPAVVTISCNQCFSVNKWIMSGEEFCWRYLLIMGRLVYERMLAHISYY